MQLRHWLRGRRHWPLETAAARAALRILRGRLQMFRVMRVELRLRLTAAGCGLVCHVRRATAGGVPSPSASRHLLSEAELYVRLVTIAARPAKGSLQTMQTIDADATIAPLA